MTQFEPTPVEPERRESEPLERIAQMLYDSVELLETYQVQPNIQLVETQRLPFGRFAEGSLATSMKWDEGFISGTLSFIAPRDDPSQRSFLFKHPISASGWSIDSEVVNDGIVLRYLDSSWPSNGEYDNTAIRSAADDEQASLHTIYEIVQRDLVPHAPYAMRENIYTYSEFIVDKHAAKSDDSYDVVRSFELALSSETDQDNFRVITAVLSTQHVVINTPDKLNCKVTVDDTGTVSIESWRTALMSHRRIDEDPADPSDVADDLKGMLEKLVAEKLSGELSN